MTSFSKADNFVSDEVRYLLVRIKVSELSRRINTLYLLFSETNSRMEKNEKEFLAGEMCSHLADLE